MAKPALRLTTLTLLLAISVAGCTRPEIEQGNFVTQSQVTKLGEGMERSAVRRTLGDPLIQDPFHPDRWDYLYLHIAADGEETRHRLTLFFDDSGEVARIVKEGAPFPEAYSPDES
ncbi:outer membrane protein assembly factor BamE [Thiohalorhabdus sp.]|uniref:outer membrane protein assembly factor BamE n=1 Tax=Thiohalorhabdus sp. TaxID=3094134 RepID=UPI002FC30422